MGHNELTRSSDQRGSTVCWRSSTVLEADDQNWNGPGKKIRNPTIISAPGRTPRFVKEDCDDLDCVSVTRSQD